MSDVATTTLRRKILGVKIRHARIRAGLNQHEIGRALGLAGGDVDALEFGLKEIDAGLLYSGKLKGQAILSLSERDGVLAIESDFKVSIA